MGKYERFGRAVCAVMLSCLISGCSAIVIHLLFGRFGMRGFIVALGVSAPLIVAYLVFPREDAGKEQKLPATAGSHQPGTIE